MKYTRASILLIFLVYLGSLFYYTKWDRQSFTNGGDSFGYYAYLPATFIHHDLKHLRYTIFARNAYSGLYRDSTVPIHDVGEVYMFKTGTPVIKYTCGIAILETPAFFTAHAIAKIFSLPADGFSPVYLFMIYLWTVLFIMPGVIVLGKVLRLYFPDYVTALVLFAIAISSNLYHFAIYNPGMSHTFLFTLYALLIYSTIRYHITFSYKHGLLVGLCVGFITLIRPNEAIAVLIPVLYGLATPGVFRKKLALLKQGSFYFMCVVALLCVVPQIAYWLYTTGHMVYYSYGGESFDFRHPHLREGLFGYVNGFFAYAPVMFLAVAGIPVLFFRRTNLLLPLLVILPIHIYVIYSWWCWFYINGIGSRPMIEMYALLALPMAAFIQWAGSVKIIRVIIIGLLLFCTAQQLMFTWRRDRNLLWTELMTERFYWNTMFKTSLDIEDLTELDTNERQPRHVTFKATLFTNDFEDSVSTRYMRNECGSGNFSLLLDNREMYFNIGKQTLGEHNVKPGDWIKVSFDACNIGPPAGMWVYTAMCAGFFRNGAGYKSIGIRVQNKIPSDRHFGVWRFDPESTGPVYFYIQVPPGALPTDEIQVYSAVDNPQKELIDNLKVEAWTENPN